MYKKRIFYFSLILHILNIWNEMLPFIKFCLIRSGRRCPTTEQSIHSIQTYVSRKHSISFKGNEVRICWTRTIVGKNILLGRTQPGIGRRNVICGWYNNKPTILPHYRSVEWVFCDLI